MDSRIFDQTRHKEITAYSEALNNSLIALEKRGEPWITGFDVDDSLENSENNEIYQFIIENTESKFKID